MNSSATSPRFLLSRFNHVGDAVLTLPVACALRDHYPDAYIAWAVEKKAAPIVRGHRAIDAVIELEPDWSQSLAGVRQVKQKLRSLEIDVAIDCQGTTKTALLGWLAGAPRRIGYEGRHARQLSRFLNNERVTPVFSHLTDRSLELLTPLGVHRPQVCWDLPIAPSAKTWASRWRRTVASTKLAIVNPGGTWPSKRWEADRFASTARYLRDRYGYRSAVIWGAYDERLMAEEIVELSASAAVLAPATDLHHLAAMIATADLFVGGDAGPLHMAVAVGTPTIGLYGATRPGESGPYRQVALQRAYEQGSWRRRRKASNAAMQAIGVEHVCQVIDEMEAGLETFARAA